MSIRPAVWSMLATIANGSPMPGTGHLFYISCHPGAFSLFRAYVADLH